MFYGHLAQKAAITVLFFMKAFVNKRVNRKINIALL